MYLADQIAQCRTPLLISNRTTGEHVRLTSAADFAAQIVECPTRFVLSDNLTRLCTALALSRGARTTYIADLLHAPAQVVWAEWAHAPWYSELALQGFARPERSSRGEQGRAGIFIKASRDGRRGIMTTLWTTGCPNGDVLASSLESYFDLDTLLGEEPYAFDGIDRSVKSVFDSYRSGGDDIMRRCFRFRYEKTWDDYYRLANLSTSQREQLWRHSLGTIALHIPLILTFFLLLATKTGLPKQVESFCALNRARTGKGKPPLLEHIEVSAPIFNESRLAPSRPPIGNGRMPRRLHHVRGHLVRRGNRVFWRVPHFRGCARLGSVRSRTVTFRFDDSPHLHEPSGETI